MGEKRTLGWFYGLCSLEKRGFETLIVWEKRENKIVVYI